MPERIAGCACGDVKKGECLRGFGGHWDMISVRALFHPTSRCFDTLGAFIYQTRAFRKGAQQLYTASYDRTINLYDLSVMGCANIIWPSRLYPRPQCIMCISCGQCRQKGKDCIFGRSSMKCSSFFGEVVAAWSENCWKAQSVNQVEKGSLNVVPTKVVFHCGRTKGMFALL